MGHVNTSKNHLDWEVIVFQLASAQCYKKNFVWVKRSQGRKMDFNISKDERFIDTPYSTPSLTFGKLGLSHWAKDSRRAATRIGAVIFLQMLRPNFPHLLQPNITACYRMQQIGEQSSSAKPDTVDFQIATAMLVFLLPSLGKQSLFWFMCYANMLRTGLSLLF